MDLSQNVKAVQEKIAAAARAAGRDPGEIALCAATKVQTDETIRAAVALEGRRTAPYSKYAACRAYG